MGKKEGENSGELEEVLECVLKEIGVHYQNFNFLKQALRKQINDQIGDITEKLYTKGYSLTEPFFTTVNLGKNLTVNIDYQGRFLELVRTGGNDRNTEDFLKNVRKIYLGILSKGKNYDYSPEIQRIHLESLKEAVKDLLKDLQAMLFTKPVMDAITKSVETLPKYYDLTFGQIVKLQNPMKIPEKIYSPRIAKGMRPEDVIPIAKILQHDFPNIYLDFCSIKMLNFLDNSTNPSMIPGT